MIPDAPGLHHLIEKAVDSLFVNGMGERAERLVLTSKDGHDLGGWCRQAIVDRLASSLMASAASPEVRTPDYWRCRACGCLWRDNHDGTVSLGGPTQRSCERCELHPTPEECEPLFRGAADRPPSSGRRSLAHAEGCHQALSVPVDLCHCGGRIVEADQPPSVEGEP